MVNPLTTELQKRNANNLFICMFIWSWPFFSYCTLNRWLAGRDVQPTPKWFPEFFWILVRMSHTCFSSYIIWICCIISPKFLNKLVYSHSVGKRNQFRSMYERINLPLLFTLFYFIVVAPCTMKLSAIFSAIMMSQSVFLFSGIIMVIYRLVKS